MTVNENQIKRNDSCMTDDGVISSLLTSGVISSVMRQSRKYNVELEKITQTSNDLVMKDDKNTRS